MKKILLITILFTVHLFALTYSEFLKQEMSQYNNFQKNIEQEYEDYQKVFFEELKNYDKNILKKWPKAEKTTNHKWVQYDNDYKSKKIIDYKKETIGLEVIAKNEKEARKRMEKLFKQLLNDDVRSAYKNDKLQQAINKKTNIKNNKVRNNQKLVSDLLKRKDRIQYKLDISNKKLSTKIYKKNKIYSIKLNLPKHSVMKKAGIYLKDVKRYSQKEQIPADLIFAIIHSESSFNPMAKSYIPAFGLMQIVPKSAGIDASFYVYGKKKLLTPNYLYNSTNNIKIGTAYLHILYFRYLKSIKDPLSRLYCTIAAYNTGAGNVAKAFTGSTNINKASKTINGLTPNQVYKRLIKKLPYLETRKYLLKVNKRRNMYSKILY
jgi:membrane-bound lytic murein transglycosylase C